MRFILLALSFLFFSAQTGAAQSVNAVITGQTRDKAVQFNGAVRFNIFSRRGKVTGNLSTGESCTGNSRINIGFTKGNGTMVCGANVTADFAFTLTSRLPTRGSGTATLSDGRIADLTIKE